MEDGPSQFHENMKKYDPNANKKQNYGPTAQRMLRLYCTDGLNESVPAVEYKPIHTLSLLTPPGTKIAIRDVWVRRGMLMLVPGGVQILGGEVQPLIAQEKQRKMEFVARLTGKLLPQESQEQKAPVVDDEPLVIEEEEPIQEEPRKRLRLIKK